MASKGAYVAGTDGTDFAHRQRVVSTHSASAQAKQYLKLTFFLHFLLNILVTLKLSEDILDRMDIFILELQELQIPKPDLWEWLYGMSILFTVFGSRAIRTNSAKMMKTYIFGIITFALGSILLAQFQYFMDFYLFIQERDLNKLKFVWRDLPLAVIFEAFAIIALQVHLFQLYYAYKLYKLWLPYSIKRRPQSNITNANSAASSESPASFSSSSSSSSSSTTTAASSYSNKKQI